MNLSSSHLEERRLLTAPYGSQTVQRIFRKARSAFFAVWSLSNSVLACIRTDNPLHIPQEVIDNAG